MAGERFGGPQRPAHPGRKARRLISSQPGRISYINTTPPSSLASTEAFQTHLLGLAVHSSVVWRRAKAEPASFVGLSGRDIVGGFGVKWQLKEKKKKSRLSVQFMQHKDYEQNTHKGKTLRYNWGRMMTIKLKIHILFMFKDRVLFFLSSIWRIAEKGTTLVFQPLTPDK